MPTQKLVCECSHSIIHNSQKVETSPMSINWGQINKMWHSQGLGAGAAPAEQAGGGDFAGGSGERAQWTTKGDGSLQTQTSPLYRDGGSRAADITEPSGPAWGVPANVGPCSELPPCWRDRMTMTEDGELLWRKNCPEIVEPRGRLFYRETWEVSQKVPRLGEASEHKGQTAGHRGNRLGEG